MNSWRHRWRHDAWINNLSRSYSHTHTAHETVTLNESLIPITLGEALRTPDVIWPFDSVLGTSYTPSMESKPVSRLVYEIFSFKSYMSHYWRYVIWINYPCGSFRRTMPWTILKYGLIPTGTVKVMACWRLWCHDYDVIVTWRHRWRHHSTALGHLPISSQ